MPAYAIVSHTWASDEVSYQNTLHPRFFADEVVRSKRRFSNIEMSCHRAHYDGYWYIWIDRCCINKTSPSELIGVFNSIFAWYWRAGIRYASLEDVPVIFAVLPDLGAGNQRVMRKSTS